MDQKPTGGFLKRLLGFAQPEAVRPSPAETAPRVENPIPQKPKAVPPLPTTEAYLNRKRGRKPLRESYADAKKLYLSIQTRGEAKPGDLAQELGMARSSLAYHLNRLVLYGYIARLGGGRSIRYRVTGVPFGNVHGRTNY